MRRKNLQIAWNAKKNQGVFKSLPAWHIFCGLLTAGVPQLVMCQLKEKGPMPQGARTRYEDPLPISTAILSNIALSLLMWNIALRVASLLLAA